jgi:hypothetical protein
VHRCGIIKSALILLPPLPLADTFEDIPDISGEVTTYTATIMTITLLLKAPSQNMYHSFN